MMRTIRLAVACVAVLVATAGQVQAGLMTVVNDVDAINNPQNFYFFENVRNGGTDILWLTGGTNYHSDFRHASIRNMWSNLGVTITDDTTSDITSYLTNRDLVVITSQFFASPGFSVTARTKIHDYIDAGGNLLFVTQTGPISSVVDDMNVLMADIGSSIRFSTASVPNGTLMPDQSTPIGAGVDFFMLDGANNLIGGTPVVANNGLVGVAFETTGVSAVPEPSSLALFGIGACVAGFGAARRRRRERQQETTA